MRGKLLFVAGAAVGYVLGARAGRKRYEQIKSAAARVWETPGIQKQVNAVEDYAAQKFGEIPGALLEGTKKVVTQVVTRAQAAQRQSASYSAPSPSGPAPRATAPSAPPPSRSYTSSVTIAAPPDEETANAPATAPTAPASKATATASGSKKRKATPPSDIDEADDAGA
jgi:oxygen-dependent protoporphyrinogen oxidase